MQLNLNYLTPRFGAFDRVADNRDFGDSYFTENAKNIHTFSVRRGDVIPAGIKRVS